MSQVQFAGVEKTEFCAMARQMGTVIRFPAGASVFSEGEAADNMYVVLAGELDLRARDKLIEKLRPGDSLGIVGLMDEQARTVSALATSDVELAVLDRRRFRYMVESVPNFVWYVMSELVGRLRATNAAL